MEILCNKGGTEIVRMLHSDNQLLQNLPSFICWHDHVVKIDSSTHPHYKSITIICAAWQGKDTSLHRARSRNSTAHHLFITTYPGHVTATRATIVYFSIWEPHHFALAHHHNTHCQDFVLLCRWRCFASISDKTLVCWAGGIQPLFVY